MRALHARGPLFIFPLSLIGPKGRRCAYGVRGGQGVRVPRWGRGDISPKHVHLLDTPEQPRYHTLRPNKYSRYLRRNRTTQGNQPRRPRGMPPRKACPRVVGGRGTQRPSPSQRPLRRPAAQAKASSPRSRGRHLLSTAPGGLNALAHPNGPAQAHGTSERPAPETSGAPSPPPQSRPITFP